MNLFNRIVTVLLLALLCVSAGYAFILVLGHDPDEHVIGHVIAKTFAPLSQLRGTLEQVSAGVISALVAAFGVYLIAVEFNPNPEKHQPIVVEESSEGVVTIDRASVKTLIARTLLSVHGIQDVSVKLGVGQSGLRVLCSITTEHNAIMTELGPEVRDEVSQRIHAQLGLHVEEVTTRFRIESFNSRKRPLL